MNPNAFVSWEGDVEKVLSNARVGLTYFLFGFCFYGGSSGQRL